MFVYLHGFASSPRSAKAVYLRERLRACGEELLIPEFDGGDFEHLTITNQLRIITDAVAGKPVTLIGSSMGGYLAALYASDHHNVDRLLLLAPAFGFTERWPASLGQATAEQWSETGWLPVYHYGQGRQTRLHSGLLADAARYPAFPDFAQPALIFHGREDDVVPVAYSEQYAATHPNVHLEILRAGHEMTGLLDEIWAKSAAFLTSQT